MFSVGFKPLLSHLHTFFFNHSKIFSFHMFCSNPRSWGLSLFMSVFPFKVKKPIPAGIEFRPAQALIGPPYPSICVYIPTNY